MTENDIVARLNANGSELDELLGAYFHGKEKVCFFAEQFKKLSKNGGMRFINTWNWGAFWLGPFYFLHRKLDAQGAVLFMMSIFSGPAFILFMAAGGMTANYFLFKQFCRDLVIADYGNSPFERVKDKMYVMGGKKTWPIVLFAIFLFLSLLFLIIIGVAMDYAINEYGY